MAGLTFPVDGEKLRSIGAIFATLKTSATSIPSMKVLVTAGGFWSIGKKWTQFNGGASPLFVAPTSGARWDLLYLDYNGYLQVVQGVASTDPVFPECPRNSFPLAGIFIQKTSTAITNEMLIDVRAIYTSSIYSHRDLSDNDYDNIHTMDAISGLTEKLSTFVSTESVSNLLNNKTDIDGTPNQSFIINKDLTGIPNENSYFWFSRGDLANVGIRYNESNNSFEFTNDGTLWAKIASNDISSVPVATTSTAGSVIVGSGLNITAGVLSAVSQTENNYLTADKEKVELFDQVFTSAEKTKLEGLNNYVHPATHDAAMIVEDATHRFMTDTDRTKLAGLDNYIHPVSHDAAMIVEDATHRFMTDTERTKLLGVEPLATADMTASEIKSAYESNSDTNAFTSTEKTKLAGLNNYTHPASHDASMIVEDVTHRFMTDAERTKLTGIEPLATADMTASEIKTAYESNSDTNAFTTVEKTKLAGLDNYVHPASHDASMIVEDATHRFMTDTERTKLTGLDNYVHPASHDATMIIEDATHRFMTDTERTKINAINTYVPTTAGDWAGAAPTTISEAIDRLAAALKTQSINI